MSDLKELQAVELDILKAVAGLCDKHGLTYALYCGTLLGAIRHKGFIPWDDDIDLAMPLKDYRRFRELAHELPYPYVMVDWDNDKCYHLPWIRIYAEGTTHMEPWEAIADMPHGIWLDIYPLIGAAPTRRRQTVQNKLIEYASFFHSGEYHRVFWYEAGWYSKILVYTPKWIRWLAGKLCMLLAVRDPDKCRMVGTIDAAPFSGKYERKDWDRMTTAVFEGQEFSVPAEYDKILRIIYGDYMQLPPEEERYGHGTAGRIIDAHRDYREYQAELKNSGMLRNSRTGKLCSE